MANEKLGEGFIEIELRLDRLEANLKAAQKKTEKTTKRMDASFGAVKKAIKAGVAALGLYAAAATAVKFDSMIKGALDTADKLDKVSSKLGVTTDFLQQAQFAAEQSGVSFETMSMAMQRWTRRAAEAAQGTGEARDAVKELGINLKDAGGNLKSSEQLFRESLAALSGVENQADKIRLAMKLFDSEGVALVNMADNFSDLTAEAEKLGIVLDRETIAKSVEAKDTLNKLGRVVSTVTTTALADMAPFAIRAAEGLSELAKFASIAMARIRDAYKLDPKGLEEAIKRQADLRLEMRKSLGALEDLERTSGAMHVDQRSDFARAASAQRNSLMLTIEQLNAVNKQVAALRERAKVEAVPAVGSLSTVTKEDADAAEEREKQRISDQVAGIRFVNRLLEKSNSEVLKSVEEQKDAQKDQWDSYTSGSAAAFSSMLADGDVNFKKLYQSFASNFTNRVLNDLVFSKLLNFGFQSISGLSGSTGTTGTGTSTAGSALSATRLTAPSPRALGSPQVNVYNQANAEVQATTGQDGSIEMFILSTVARDVANGGIIPQTQEARYGALRARGR